MHAFPLLLGAQVTHDSLYVQLLREYAEQVERPVRKVSGGIFPADTLLFAYDSLSILEIKIGEALVEFTSLPEKKYIRSLSISIQQKDSILRQKNVRYVDTLHWKLLKQLRKQSSPQLRGDDPSPWGKWIGPALLISAGIGGIFAVFFLRSN